MPLRNLGYRRPVDANRHDDVEFLLGTPAPPPFDSKNPDTHRKPYLGHFTNNSVTHV